MDHELIRRRAPIRIGPTKSRRDLRRYAVAIGVLVAWWGLSFTTPIDWDLGWQLHLAGRLLAGDRYYVDVAMTDMHPPLYTWVCMLVLMVARLVHVGSARLFLVVVNLASLALAGVAWRIARGDALLLVGLGFAALAAHGVALGSGEQIAVACALPYLVAAAKAPLGDTPNWRVRVAIGLVAGFGLAMKPHYAIVWFGTELWLAIKARTWRSFRRAESVAAISVWIAYIFAAALITPGLFRSAMLAARFYNDFMPVPAAVLLLHWSGLPLIAAWCWWLLARRRDLLVLAFLVAATGMWATAVAQMKPWTHNWTPTIALTAVAYTALLARRGSGRPVLIAGILGSLWLTNGIETLRRLEVGHPTYLPRMMDALARHAPHGPILTLAYGLSPSFPLVNLTGAEWTLNEGSLWIAPVLYRDQWGKERIRYREPQEWDRTEQALRDGVWRGIQQRPPRLLVTQVRMDNGFDFVNAVGKVTHRRRGKTDPPPEFIRVVRLLSAGGGRG